jgi:hypothetical protein
LLKLRIKTHGGSSHTGSDSCSKVNSDSKFGLAREQFCILITLIIVPMVNHRSGPGHKHDNLGKSSLFHQIQFIFRKTATKSHKKQNTMLLGCGFLRCCSRGNPGGYFGAICGAPGGAGAERLPSIGTIYKRFRSTRFCVELGIAAQRLAT